MKVTSQILIGRLESRASAAAMQALIPGFGLAVEMLNEFLEELSLRAAAASGQGAALAAPEPGEALRVRTPRSARNASAIPDAIRGKRLSYGWPEDPEERSAEMKRRQAVARSKKQSQGAKNRWARMTKKQRDEWYRKITAGRAKAKRAAKKIAKAAPTVKTVKEDRRSPEANVAKLEQTA